jgi:hypothetical protein
MNFSREKKIGQNLSCLELISAPKKFKKLLDQIGFLYFSEKKNKNMHYVVFEMFTV